MYRHNQEIDVGIIPNRSDVTDFIEYMHFLGMYLFCAVVAYE